MGNDSASGEDGSKCPFRNNSWKNEGFNKFHSVSGVLDHDVDIKMEQNIRPSEGIKNVERITCSGGVSKKGLPKKDRDYGLAVKGYGMKLRRSKKCFHLSWILEEEISKVIDLGVAVGFDFNGKEVKMADIVAKAYSKLMGFKLKMAK